MKIKISRESLLEPLLQINGVVERRQTLPILANVLIQCQKDQMALTATDLEVEMRTVTLCECDEEFEFTLPARKLLDICKALPEESNISLSIDNKDRATLRSGRGRYALGVLSATEYPSIEIATADTKFDIEERQLKQLIDKTGFAMAQQDVRYYLNGMLIEISAKRVRAVATDGHRLALSDAEVETGFEEEKKIILPRKAALELHRFLSDSETPVTIELSQNHIRFIRGSTTFTSKLIDGRFPDYERVIPPQGDKLLTIERDLLKQVLQRASILSNEKYRGIRFSLSENLIHLTANNPEQEQAEEEIVIEYSKEEMSIGFNVGYLLDVLGVIDTENVVMTLTDPNSSCIVTPEGSEQSRYVVMPMRL
ncbi:DNA polymerase III subunit beta [Solemya velum gill symbiont]|uniref:DNA polymerase III subunit beta n=1 Tax=Solemya velum gill symbiont TaxID=2340 RepID=UPI000996BDAE|nr:DNA polymerase III subunit beta [Solemya velum gill symbiont]OOZ09374.1 DNA polymerase III subunit beta [Solemya velum gill symbiont]